MGPFKSKEHIRADLELDIKENKCRTDAIRDACAALRGSYGYTIVEALCIVILWQMDIEDAKQ